MSAVDDHPTLPFERPDVLGIAPRYRELQENDVPVRVRTPAGDLAWLATRYEQVRGLFGNPSLGRSHPDPDRAARFLNASLLGGPVGDSRTEQAEHARMRATLGRAFSARRIEAMRPRVQSIVDDLLSELAHGDPPADLHEAFCFPLPALVICEMLGVRYEDRDDFRGWSDGAIDIQDPQHAMRSLESLNAYMRGLIEEKRAQPGEDVISDMVEASGDRGMSEQELSMLAVALFLGGHETTVARMDFGALYLLTHDAQRETLQRDPSVASPAVEEILRMSVPGLGLIPRYAAADIDVDGAAIAAGDLVLLCTGAANRDARVFGRPDDFDVTRETNPHVAFGYGIHFCLGASLARLELQCAFASLFQRLPALRLAVPVEQLHLRGNVFTGGLVSLPVTW